MVSLGHPSERRCHPGGPPLCGRANLLPCWLLSFRRSCVSLPMNASAVSRSQLWPAATRAPARRGRGCWHAVSLPRRRESRQDHRISVQAEVGVTASGATAASGLWVMPGTLSAVAGTTNREDKHCDALRSPRTSDGRRGPRRHKALAKPAILQDYQHNTAYRAFGRTAPRATTCGCPT